MSVTRRGAGCGGRRRARRVAPKAQVQAASHPAAAKVADNRTMNVCLAETSSPVSAPPIKMTRGMRLRWEEPDLAEENTEPLLNLDGNRPSALKTRGPIVAPPRPARPVRISVQVPEQPSPFAHGVPHGGIND